ncbi:MAG: PilZ domain-containing protein [Xanthobacteraceae bacterium]
MGERRQSERQRSFLRGCVYFNKRRNAFDCLIRDISSTGARIIFSDTVSVPDIIDLYIPQKEQTVRAHVQWRRGDEIGLVFADALCATGATPAITALTARVAQLESEIVALRRMLKRLTKQIGDDADAA